MARHPSRANRSLDETALKRDFQNAPGFRTSDRARPRAGHSKSERQSTHVFKLDEPVPKWLKLWRATGPTPTAVSDPIENVEVSRMDTSDDEALRDAMPAVRALRHDPGGAQLPKDKKKGQGESQGQGQNANDTHAQSGPNGRKWLCIFR